MLLIPRFFCRYLCPFGAVFSLLPVLPVSVVGRDRENCLKGCSLCQKVCPAGISLPDRNGDYTQIMGECFSCGRCAGGCPRGNCGNISMAGGKRGLVLQLLKLGSLVAILAALTYLPA